MISSKEERLWLEILVGFLDEPFRESRESMHQSLAH